MKDFHFTCSGHATFLCTVQAETPEDAWRKINRDNFRRNLSWEYDGHSPERDTSGICEEFQCDEGGWYCYHPEKGDVEILVLPEEPEDRTNEMCSTCHAEGTHCPEMHTDDPDPDEPIMEIAAWERFKKDTRPPTGRINGDGTITYLLEGSAIRKMAAMVTLPASATAGDVMQSLRDDKVEWTYDEATRYYYAKNPVTHEEVHSATVLPPRYYIKDK